MYSEGMTRVATIERKKPANSRTSVRRNDLLQPFLKWAGGKRQLVPEIRKYVPHKFKLYFEPFVGAGAVLFDLQPQAALINDANEELVNCYRVIKKDPEGLIAHARQHRNTKEYFYSLRSLDREPGFKSLSALERASRIIFLNKTCYNGLFRVNSQGQFNVPFGKYTNPVIVDEIVIRAVSRFFNEARVEVSNEDFEVALSGAGRGDFVYLDPPYDPLSDTSSFTGYNLNSFGRNEQQRLQRVCDDLTRRGCKVLLSNSATEFIRDLYSDTTRYTIVEVEANRNINSVGTSRGKISELLIFNNNNAV
ncbi:MAG TPA: DNA adenine methylase [Pyrinomonadaceae bacterium]|nr:DNA adenine methylase [Pyrinomonadaceae bacterium]